jgi:hypothetical protein
VLLRTELGGSDHTPAEDAARRYLHQAAVPGPSAVAEFVAELAAGGDVGTVNPPSCPEHEYGPDRGRTRVMANLARFALPEVRRWLTTRT